MVSLTVDERAVEQALGATAIIPARGGSKGIALKNLRCIGGKSLLRRAVETCHAAGIHDVIVSTDHPAISAEATACGAYVRSRPAELCGDDVGSWPVIKDAIGATLAKTILWVQCTAPLMTPLDIRNCIDHLHGGQYDLVFACHESHAFLFREDGTPINMTIPIPRRQDFPTQYAISGSVWACRREHLDRDEIYSGKLGIVVSENPMRLDIDTEDDLRFAERLLTN